MSKPLLLVISQVYVPDPASVGQHMADAAECLATRGYRVTVLTSARGYEHPEVRYPYRELRSGVRIVRLPLSSFGKKSITRRLLGQLFFLLQVIVRGICSRRLTGIVVSTSPPMASFAALVISYIRRVPITYWLMDFNPDQALALGKATERSPLVRAMKWLNRRIFSRASDVVVLDRFMLERVQQQYQVSGRLEIIPPWPHDESLEDVSPASNPFVNEHNPDGRFVVMYSGNHSLASPISTLLQAAVELRDDTRFRFLFIGDGLGKREVHETIKTHRLKNIESLPYQPLERIRYSLSAADLHVVTLGNEMAGIIHPCKVYGAMAVGRPVLLIGPRPSHASDLIDQFQIGYQVDHDDVAGVIATIRRVEALPAAERGSICERAHTAVREHFSKDKLCAGFCDVVERSAKAASVPATLPGTPSCRTALPATAPIKHRA